MILFSSSSFDAHVLSVCKFICLLYFGIMQHSHFETNPFSREGVKWWTSKFSLQVYLQFNQLICFLEAGYNNLTLHLVWRIYSLITSSFVLRI